MSLLSSSLVNFAVIIWLSLETGSAEVLAYAAIAALLPQSALGLFAGVFIDRWDRKKTMIIADGFIAFCTLGISLLFYFGQVELWYIYLLLAENGWVVRKNADGTTERIEKIPQPTI